MQCDGGTGGMGMQVDEDMGGIYGWDGDTGEMRMQVDRDMSGMGIWVG